MGLIDADGTNRGEPIVVIRVPVNSLESFWGSYDQLAIGWRRRGQGFIL
jgi:hypothetical protein